MRLAPSTNQSTQRSTFNNTDLTSCKKWSPLKRLCFFFCASIFLWKKTQTKNTTSRKCVNVFFLTEKLIQWENCLWPCCQVNTYFPDKHWGLGSGRSCNLNIFILLENSIIFPHWLTLRCESTHHARTLGMPLVCLKNKRIREPLNVRDPRC